MNKQEAIEKIEKGKSNFNAWEDLIRNRAFEDALTIVKKIDEPERPVVPQFVADWYEEHKDNFEWNLYNFCVQFYNEDEELNRDVWRWFGYDANKPIETLVMMHKFGYEVEKEKLYTVEIPNPNGGEYGRVFLGKYNSGKVGLHCWTSYKQINFDDSWKKDKIAQLTEAEIKEDFAWAWQFAEEVEECNQER